MSSQDTTPPISSQEPQPAPAPSNDPTTIPIALAAQQTPIPMEQDQPAAAQPAAQPPATPTPVNIVHPVFADDAGHHNTPVMPPDSSKLYTAQQRSEEIPPPKTGEDMNHVLACYSGIAPDKSGTLSERERSHTHTHTHTHKHSLTHSLTHSPMSLLYIQAITHTDAAFALP